MNFAVPASKKKTLNRHRSPPPPAPMPIFSRTHANLPQLEKAADFVPSPFTLQSYSGLPKIFFFFRRFVLLLLLDAFYAFLGGTFSTGSVFYFFPDWLLSRFFSFFDATSGKPPLSFFSVTLPLHARKTVDDLSGELFGPFSSLWSQV